MASRCIQQVLGRTAALRPPPPGSPARAAVASARVTTSSAVVPRRTAVTTASGAILEEPQREVRFGLMKVMATVLTGLGIGAWMSKKFATFLEENELFVPEDDDEDDD